jgi:hypothetical protein
MHGVKIGRKRGIKKLAKITIKIEYTAQQYQVCVLSIQVYSISRLTHNLPVKTSDTITTPDTIF